MVIFALDWYIWATLGALFAYALLRRVLRTWRDRHHARRANAHNSKRP